MSIKDKLFLIRKEVGKVSKDTKNPFYNSKYADVNQLIELTDPLFEKHNILCLQPIRDGHLVTELTDLETGDVLTSEIELPKNNDPQKTGSAITYFRRYSLKSLLNIQEEDDDANKAVTQSNSSNSNGDDARPWLTEKAYNKILERINAGENLFDQTKKAFKMKKDYSASLKEAENKHGK